MLVRLLGPVDVVGVTGVTGAIGVDDVVAVPGERRRSVLAALALHPGDVVSLGTIVDAVWGESPPTTARNTVQSHVAFLRRLLGDAGAITNRAPGYALVTPGVATDVVAFTALALEASAASPAAERIRLRRNALALWRGPALADVGGSASLARHAQVLDEQRVALTERVLADVIRLGGHADVVGELELLIGLHPYRERLTELLVTALYRCGRAADALAAYAALDRLLRDELGTQPGRALARLQHRVLARDPGLLVPAGDDPAPVVSPPTGATATGARTGRSPTRLPRPHRLVARDDELARLGALHERSRLVSVVGMGGVGKTRLVAELAATRRSAGATVHEVDVTPALPSTVDEVVAAALAVEPSEGVDVADSLAAALGTAPTLLVLDNCDTVVESVADLVARLLVRTESVQVVVTSRAPLHLEEEECLLLDPLAVEPVGDEQPPAVRFLVDRARAADPAFSLTADNRSALVEVCVRLGGLPLALEIVGPRLRSLTPAELLEGLGGSRPDAGGGRTEVDRSVLDWPHVLRDVPEHHRSLRSLIDLSHGLLSAEESSALEALSALEGGAWLADAVLLCDTAVARLGDQAPAVPHRRADSGEDLLRRLVDRSLVERREREGRSWVNVHALVLAFLREHVGAAGRAAAVAADHARWVARLVESAADDLRGPRSPAVLRARLLDERNTVAALEWAFRHDGELLARMVSVMWWYWYRVGAPRDGLEWTQRALGSGVLDTSLRARVCGAAGYLAWQLDDYPLATRLAREALDAAGVDERTVGLAHNVLSRALGDVGDFAAAAPEATAGLLAYERSGDPWGVAWSRRCLAAALFYGGQVLDAAEAGSAAYGEFAAAGDAWGVAGSLDLLARFAQQDGRTDEAIALSRRALAAHRACLDSSGERSARQHLAEALWATGDLDAARREAVAALALCDEHGFLTGALQAVLLLADVARARGDVAAVARASARASRLVETLGAGAEVSLALAAGRASGAGGG